MVNIGIFFAPYNPVPQYCHIGKLAATFGLTGQLILDHKLGKKSSLKGLDVVFLEMKGGALLPYFLEAAEAKNEQQTCLKLEGVNTREAALALVARPVWLTEEMFKKYTSPSAPLSLLGYQIVDGNTELGVVREVIEQSLQTWCRIDWKGKEALIPLHDHFIRKIDPRQKKVYLDLPEGLLDIYE